MARRRGTRVFTTSPRRRLGTFFHAEDAVPEAFKERFDRDFDRDIIDHSGIRLPRAPRPRREREEREIHGVIFGHARRWIKLLCYITILVGFASFFLPYFLPTALPRPVYALIPLALALLFLFLFRFTRRLDKPRYHMFPIILLFLGVTFIAVWNMVQNLDITKIITWQNYGYITSTEATEVTNRALGFRIAILLLTLGMTVFGALFGRRRYSGLLSSVVAVAGLTIWDWVFNDYILAYSTVEAAPTFSLLHASLLLSGIAVFEFAFAIFSFYYYGRRR